MKDGFCNNTDEKKQLDFYEIFSLGYEYVFEVCRNPFSALCKELDELMESGKCDGAKPLTKPKNCNLFSSFDEEFVSKCFLHLVCKLNDTEEIYQILDGFSDPIKTKAWELIHQITGMECYHSPEQFEKVRVIACDYTDEKKKSCFYEFFSAGCEYVMESCINPFAALCRELDDTMMKISSFIKEVEEDGRCEEFKTTRNKPKQKSIFG
ncbi:hypothetical protein HNY73_022059 [Argiope bruennichi]|nr:hypothetical protein HNY73_022059 [Argiope bruennichi]